MITLIIPTKNRVLFLRRLLRYLADNQYRHFLLIGDASDDEHAAQIKDTVGDFKGRLKITYYSCLGLSISATVQRLNQLVTTPYVTLIADDDFLVPRGLEKCLNFLESHKDYSAAHGLGALTTLKESGPCGDIKEVGAYRLGAVEGETGPQRLTEFMNNYFVSLFSLHRTPIWKIMWEEAGAIEDVAFAAELLPCSLSAVKGKIKQLDCFYLVRQGHDRRYLLPKPHEWITKPEWFSSYEVYHHCLAEELAKDKKISIEKAGSIVKEAFGNYLAKGLANKYQGRYGKKDLRNYFKTTFKEIPILNGGLSVAWRKAIGMRDYYFPSNRISLAALMSPQSVYNKDFMPIYNALTAK